MISKMKKEIGTDEFKKISLDILLAVHEFCQRNNVKYSLACGTLIGAIRHKGFIPWDDDIDIYMVREDYERFVSLFPQLYKSRYSILAFSNEPSWNVPYAKVYDSRTLYYEEKKYDFEGIGISIDVFPIDNAPDDLNTWIKYERRRVLLKNLYVMKELKWRKNRPLIKNLFVEFCSLLLYPFSKKSLALMLDRYAKKYNSIETNYYTESCLGVPNGRFLKKDFETTNDCLFDNYTFKVMAGYDDYLHQFFGNYMELPPLEERISHHRYTAYWK